MILDQCKGENDRRKYIMINLRERMLPTRRGSNPQPPDHQSDAHPTEPPSPAWEGIGVSHIWNWYIYAPKFKNMGLGAVTH